MGALFFAQSLLDESLHLPTSFSTLTMQVAKLPLLMRNHCTRHHETWGEASVVQRAVDKYLGVEIISIAGSSEAGQEGSQETNPTSMTGSSSEDPNTSEGHDSIEEELSLDGSTRTCSTSNNTSSSSSSSSGGTQEDDSEEEPTGHDDITTSRSNSNSNSNSNNNTNTNTTSSTTNSGGTEEDDSEEEPTGHDDITTSSNKYTNSDDDDTSNKEEELGQEFPWDRRWAKELLQSGPMTNFQIPRPTSTPTRTRLAAEFVEETWPKLQTQLEFLLRQLTVDVCPDREQNEAVGDSTCKKVSLAVKSFMSYCHHQEHQADIGMELLLSAPFLQSWIIYNLGNRGISFTTSSGYLTSIAQTIVGLRQLRVPLLGSTMVDKLLTDLKSVRRQLNTKAKAAKGQDLMKQAIHIQRVIARQDPEEMAQLPGKQNHEY